MEVLGLDKDFNVACQLYPTNTQWNRKYYEAGDFVVTIPAEQYSTEITYIYSKELQELGMAQKVNWKGSSSGNTVSIEGFFYEKVLDDDVIYPTFYGKGNINEVIKSMINTYAGIQMDFDLDTSLQETVDFQETGTSLGEKLYELLQLYEYSYSINYDFEANKFVFRTYKGLDATQSNAEGNNFITFATTWQNLSNPDVITDDSDFKNFAIVAGAGEAEDRIVVEVDHSNGGKKKKLFVDAKSDRYDSSKQTLQDYKNGLIQKGEEELLDHVQITNVNFDPLLTGYEYHTDYDLGTKCEAIIEDMGLQIQGRIVEIHEVWKAGQHTLEIELGNQILSKIKKLERKVML